MKNNFGNKKFKKGIIIPIIIVSLLVIVGLVFFLCKIIGKESTNSKNSTENFTTTDFPISEGNTTTNKETIENGETSGEEVTTEDITTEYENETTEPITEPSLEGETETTFVSEWEPESEAPWVPQPTDPPAPGETNPPTVAPTTSAPTQPATTPAAGEIVTDYVFIEDKNPTYVMGYYKHESKNVAGKTIECLYLKDVQHEYEWDIMGDVYLLKWNDWMYFNFDTKEEGNHTTNGFINKDDEYEGKKISEQNYTTPHVTNVYTGNGYSRYINGKNINVMADFIKPYFYDSVTQTITTKSKDFVPRDIYLSYIAKDLDKYEISQLVKDILLEEAGYLYDFYVFWYKNLKGTEFDGFVYEGLSWNGVTKIVALYYNDESMSYDLYMEHINKVSKK